MQTFIICRLAIKKPLNHPGLLVFTVSSSPLVSGRGISPFPGTKLSAYSGFWMYAQSTHPLGKVYPLTQVKEYYS